MTVAAKFENGVFRPLEAITLREGTVVEIELPLECATAPKDAFSVLDAGFFGLWKDRTDIEDSVDYVNQLRAKPRR